MNPADSIVRLTLNKAIDYLMADPANNMAKAMNTVNKYVPANIFPSQREAFSHSIEQQNNWYQLLVKALTLNPEVMPSLIKTLVVESNILAWGKQEKMREKYHCNIPWAILLDPTSACNLRCKGCWAADYGYKLNLTYDDIDSIITQGKELGVHIYIYTGGEPLVRKDDIIKLCEKHSDCTFLCFTNSTLIDEKFCQEMIRVKNFVPAISVEGFEETTDARRGKGTYARIQHAMGLLRENKLPFGVSVCYTSQNASAVCTPEYFDWLIDQGALFAWIFTYMPIGTDAPVDLMATAEQRAQLYHHVRAMRQTKPLFTLDFWNDGEFVGGCIAGGRRYLHINARGDVEPCVFAHYSSANIHDVSLLDALRSPLFMKYHDNQPFDGNYLRPCPILDNPYKLEQMVEESGAYSTDLVHEESAHDLCAKCAPAAREWYPVATQLWDNPDDPRFEKRTTDPNMGMAKSDVEKFKNLGRDWHECREPEAPRSGEKPLVRPVPYAQQAPAQAEAKPEETPVEAVSEATTEVKIGA